MKFTHILLPTLPQADTITAIFLLKKYGVKTFPGIDHCEYGILYETEEGLNEVDYLKQGKILIDVGGGIFDHHNKPEKTTATNLVVNALGLENEKALEKLVAYTERDDFYGKGTISNDPLDKAFGLSGLIAALKKAHPNDPSYIIDCVLPLLDAHLLREKQRTEDLPKEFERLKLEHNFNETQVTQRRNKLKVCFLESDNTQMPGFLRAVDGGKFDIVVQRRSTGHVNILTRQLKRPDLREVARLIRSKEYEIDMGASYLSSEKFREPGRVNEVGVWYFDPATDSLQNGGVSPDKVDPTKIPWDEMKKLVLEGLSTV
ncbi:MAG TPA: hypothetical protein VG621_00260 [Candidatus Paceibacterota bacterium]|nr:hypothetical protein [Candidatus Paceibacterota bacterium]